MGNAMPRTQQRAKRKGAVKNLSKDMLEKYDKSKTNSLNAEEVKAMASALLTQYTPQVGGVTDEDVDLIMRLGGDTCHAEITYQELPQALAMVQIIREENKYVNELFDKHDKDNSGALAPEQLKSLLTDIYEGQEPSDADIAYILKQCEPRGKSDPIARPALKAALACWYCLHSTEESENIKDIFRAWDTNNSGVIEKEQLIDVLSKLPPTAGQPREALEKIFTTVDKNGDGKIQYEEFVDWITQGVHVPDAASGKS